MVDSNVAVASGAVDPVPTNPNGLSPAEATQNIEYLRTQAESWLAVLFNVFGTVGRDSRGIVGDVITVWAAIAGEQVRIASFRWSTSH
jgi:ribosomal RNA-processing protein 12